jgi:hypothetical protein
MTTLRKTIIERDDSYEKRLLITVFYSPVDKVATRVIKVCSEVNMYWMKGDQIQYSSFTTINDITDIILKNLPGWERDILQMDWTSVYENNLQTKSQEVA